jgi:hypothetical protein
VEAVALERFENRGHEKTGRLERELRVEPGKVSRRLFGGWLRKDA